MADGALNLTLDDYTSAKLAEKAKALGISREELALSVLGDQFFDYDDFTWINGDPREDTGEVSEEGARDWEEVQPEMEAYLAARLGPAD
ncbi:hypothetical protein [Brevundimonas sp.]|uniref:hypothetical protein n=1 Tax=Brevundimonas sp. TaxID=1871086 RepID=UPI001A1B01B8|nr:hypothetical protein [Brevundimonas sp.]MBJ7484307.1 hypothetical protein [Brevundimonas sp.]